MTDAAAQQYQRLRDSVAEVHGESEASALDQVFAVAERAHRGERRKSGDPYITHPIAVASIVNGWGLSATVVRAALAHDLGDSPGRSGDVGRFELDLGPTVLAYVRAAQRLNGLNVRGHEDVSDLDVDLTSNFGRNTAMLKIADRLHNARTWEFIPRQKARLKAHETLALIAPAAKALSLPDVAGELRSLSAATLAQPVGVASAFLDGALRVLPAELQERYRDEWLADLAHLETRRERAAMAAGLLWSAWAIRRQSLG